MQLGRSNKSIISQHVFIKLQSIKFSIPVGRQAYVVKISQLLLICSQHHHTIISCLQFTCTKVYSLHTQMFISFFGSFTAIRWGEGSWGPPRKFQHFPTDHCLLIVATVIWMKYCWNGLNPIQSINQFIRSNE